MAGEYEIWITTDQGAKLALIDTFTRLQYSILAGGLGHVALLAPRSFDTRLVSPDNTIQVWRAPGGARMSLERLYLLRYYRWFRDGDRLMLEIKGPDLLDLLGRRIVAYAAGLAFTAKTDFADDMMRELVNENLVGATDVDRNLSFLSVDAAIGKGPILQMRFEWQNVLEAIKNIQEASRVAGTEVFFDVRVSSVSSSAFTCAFTSKTGQPGQDRTSQGVLFSEEKGTLREAFLEYDYSAEENYIYAIGQGASGVKKTEEVSDTDRIQVSRFGRCEGYVSASGRDATELREIGRDSLSRGRPRQRFGGQPIDTEGSRYGIHWEVGDKVKAAFLEKEFECIIRSVVVTVEDGAEAIDARLEYESE